MPETHPGNDTGTGTHPGNDTGIKPGSDTGVGTHSGHGAGERQPVTVSRRQLLRTAMWGSLGIWALEGAGSSLDLLWPRKVTGFGGKIVAGKVSDFQVGQVTKVPEGKFYLVRLEPGFLALYWKCPHLGCTVPWSPPEDPGRFHCPCHGSVFEITGQKIAGPSPRSMDIMAIEIVDGEVIVDTGKITERPNFSPSEITPA